MNRLFRMPPGGDSGWQKGQSPRRDFSTIETGLDRQPKCMGCKYIGYLMKKTPPTVPLCFHNSYEELDKCADHCVTCRLFRRALILHQPTADGSYMLGTVPSQVQAYLKNQDTLVISLGINPYDKTPIVKTASISISPPPAPSIRTPTPTSPHVMQMWNSMIPSNSTALAASSIPSPMMPPEKRLSEYANTEQVFGQVKKWAADCRGHPKCGNLTWSNKSAARLIRILSGQRVQLVENIGEELVEYTALSYCWGIPTESDKYIFEKGQTKKSNISKRKQGFPVDDLPAAIMDAVQFTFAIGLSYIWVDMICIIQDDLDDWTIQAAQMGEIYANSYFTICAYSVDRVTAELFNRREAWRYPIEPCRLNQRRLTIEDPILQDVKALAPWASRGWTLQEEILSPRRLYWGPQKMFWVCCEAHETESGLLPPKYRAKQANSVPAIVTNDLTRKFLTASRTGSSLHERWQELIEMYTSRYLTKNEDRFNAIAGLAARYKLTNPNDVFMAGLWHETFAQDLAWRIEKAVLQATDQSNCSPSWSWASLPMGVPALMSRESGVGRITIEDAVSDEASENIISTTDVNSVTVTGRVRSLGRSCSIPCSWTDVAEDNTQRVQFSFSKFVDRDVHCLNHETGLLLAYEAHRQESLCHLDYTPETENIDVVSIECLELTQSTMLLLKACSLDEESKLTTYKRVGVSWKFRADFFKNAKEATIQMV